MSPSSCIVEVTEAQRGAMMNDSDIRGRLQKGTLEPRCPVSPIPSLSLAVNDGAQDNSQLSSMSAVVNEMGIGASTASVDFFIQVLLYLTPRRGTDGTLPPLAADVPIRQQGGQDPDVGIFLVTMLAWAVRLA